MNKCMFSGRMVRDPELKEFSSGKKVVRFTIAVDRRYQNSDGKWESDPSFLDFEAWDKGAETIFQRYRKGDFILIDDASVKTDRWDDKNTGEKRQKLCFRCNHFELLPLLNSAKDEESDEPPVRETKTSKGGKRQAPKNEEPEDDAEAGDIPF